MGIASVNCGRVVEVIFTIWVAYSVYANLIEHRVTRLGFDGLLMSLIGLMAGKDVARQARKDPRVVKRMAVMMILVALGGIWDIVVLIVKHG